MEDASITLVLVGLLSIFCQYFAYRINLPAILPLLLVGIVVGPGLHILDADALFGDLLFPIVSLSVAIILFEGALTLKLKEIKGHSKMIRNLCTIGCLITMAVATLAAYMLIELPTSIAFLFGAIVTVTGPTVIVPMLRTVRPNAKISSVLRWEGIIIDPIGALLAVLVFEFVVASQDALSHTLFAFAMTIGTGVLFGCATGWGLGTALKKNWIPAYLQNTAVLTIILGAFAASNHLAHESGLITVTIVGIVLANMKDVEVDDILEFKETLSVLLISGLFILLATRLNFAPILELGWGMLGVVAVIMFVARPLAVFGSSFKTGLSVRELGLISWIAPRGIVAAAVSALFSLKLEESGHPEAAVLVPMVFMVIIMTVVVQSLTAKTVANWLKVRAEPARGFLLFGANPFARALAKEMQEQGVDVRLADTNWEAISEARMANIPTYYGNPMSEHASRNLDLTSVAQVLIISPYQQLNPLVAFHFDNLLGKGCVWGLSTNEKIKNPRHQVSEEYGKKLRLFDEGVTYRYLMSQFNKGAIIKTTKLSESFSFDDYQAEYQDKALPLLTINADKRVTLCLSDTKPKIFEKGTKIISLIKE